MVENQMNDKKYQITLEQDKLKFRTSSYKAEKTSVLPPGVYTKEFASMLFASGLSIAAYLLINRVNSRAAIIQFAILLLIFIIGFIGSKKFIFKDRYLEIDFDKANKTVNIIRPGIVFKKTESIPFSKIKSVELGNKRFVPENMDGINFVQKISLQHGSAVPGLGDIEEYVTLSLKLTDGSERIIYAAKVDEEPSLPLKEIRSFLEGNV